MDDFSKTMNARKTILEMLDDRGIVYRMSIKKLIQILSAT